MPFLFGNKDSYIYEVNASAINTTVFNKTNDTTEHTYTKNDNPIEYNAGKSILKINNNCEKSPAEKQASIAQILRKMGIDETLIYSRIYSESATETDPITGEVKKKLNKDVATKALQSLIDFFNEWKVDICILLASPPINLITRSFISAAALFVKVIARIL